MGTERWREGRRVKWTVRQTPHTATPQKPPVACSHEHLKLLVPLGISFVAFITSLADGRATIVHVTLLCSHWTVLLLNTEKSS